MAEMLARAGAVGQGEVLAGSIGDFAWQARALIRMARALAEAGDTHLGRELAGQAQAALATVLAARTGTLEAPAHRTDPASGDIAPARIAANPAGDRLRQLLALALAPGE